MNKAELEILDDLINRYGGLRKAREEIIESFDILSRTFSSNHKLLICGNGGSNADSLHIVGELMKSFVKKRPIGEDLKNKLVNIDKTKGMELSDSLEMPLRAIALGTEHSLDSAFSNDVSGKLSFAEEVLGLGDKGDTLLAISTSGNSENTLYAVITAKALGLNTIGLTGENGGELNKLCDSCIRVGERETYKVQELHLPVYHALCRMLEEEFF